MAKGDPLKAKQIFEELDETWFVLWQAWRIENMKAAEKNNK